MTIKRGLFGLPVLKKSVKSTLMFIFSVIASLLLLTVGKEYPSSTLSGYVIVTIFCFLILYLFIYQYQRSILQTLHKSFFILATLLLFLFVTRVVSDKCSERMLLLIPFTIIPIVIKTFFDNGTAFYVHLVALMLSSIIIQSYEFIIINIAVGSISIFVMDSIYKETRILFTAVVVIICYCLIYSGVSLVKGTDEFFAADYSLFAINGFLLLLSYPIIAVFEKNFLMLTDNTLLSLSDKEQPLLRKLANEAPGSFHHSLQVANLAEEAAREIGINSLLVRVGALYHDIGKIANPIYFVENQTENVSPHDSIDPRESAKIIISHINKGIVLGKNYKLPQQVIDFIATHHGTSVVYFFYKKYVDNNPQDKNSLKLFSYPGPKPFSKETAIVMMADAVEAASRSMGDYSEDSIDNLVEKITYLQEQDGQFSDVPLTYKEMSDIKKSFKKTLANIHHARVAYPER
ncbi:MAG: HDIG domain-containing protein [Bacteroidales bacterium]|nr:HDIG domain-containing protein [Bacteroidales bacterium]